VERFITKNRKIILGAINAVQINPIF